MLSIDGSVPNLGMGSVINLVYVHARSAGREIYRTPMRLYTPTDTRRFRLSREVFK